MWTETYTYREVLHHPLTFKVEFSFAVNVRCFNFDSRLAQNLPIRSCHGRRGATDSALDF